MRIVNRKEFLTLPEGTLFQEGEPWVFGDLCVKHDSLIYGEDSDDYICQRPTNVEADSSEQLFDRLDDMQQNGASYPLDLGSTERDGCFVRDAIYMIYEKADITALRDLFIDLADGKIPDAD